MRNIMKTLVAGIIAVFTYAAWADTWTDPDTGDTWTYNIIGEGATIISPTPSGDVEVPDTLGGKPVTAIGLSSNNRRLLVGRW